MTTPREGAQAAADRIGVPLPRTWARTSDPETSRLAAQSVTRLTEKQTAVLRLMRVARHGMTDHGLVALYTAQAGEGRCPRQSESGIRTRRAELVARGRVVDTGTRVRLASGRSAVVWKAAA